MEELEEAGRNVEEDNTPIPFNDRMKLLFTVHWRGFISVLTPLLLLPILAPFPSQPWQICAYVLLLMALFWVFECIPLAITSVIPIIVFPVTGVMSCTDTCLCYMNDTIVMFLESMMLASAVEQSGLHKRLALGAIRLIGYSHYRLLFALSFITMFISMWITNTAATTLMVPINFALLSVFEELGLLEIYSEDQNGNVAASDITTCYFCTATFSATIGGVGTLVGTATNLVFKGLFSKAYPNAPEYLSFPKYSAFAVPYMLVMEISVYFVMIVIYLGFLRPKSKEAKASRLPPEAQKAAKLIVDKEWEKLGKITFWEIMVIILFGAAILLFFSRSPQIFTGWGDAIRIFFEEENPKFIEDSTVGSIIVVLMLLLPSTLDFFKHCAKDKGAPTGPIPSVLNWTPMNEVLPYSFMFLLGGGFALSEAAKKDRTDLNGRIGDVLKQMTNLPNFFIILLIIIFTVFSTNFASNVAVCNIIAPIVMQMGHEIGKNPLWYNLAAGVSASFCFCLPVGTPGNLVIQGAAKIPTGKMIFAGFGPTIIVILISWFSIVVWAPVIWPDLYLTPDWIHNQVDMYY